MSSYLKFDGRDDVTRALIVWPDFPVLGAGTFCMTAFVRFLSWPSELCCVMATESTNTSTGIFVGGGSRITALRGAYCVDLFGTPFQLNFTANGVDGAGTPFSLGRIYKLALAGSVNAGGATDVRMYVDAVQVGSGVFAFPLCNYGGGGVGFNVGGRHSRMAAGQPPRSAHMDVIQVMYEFDRNPATLFPPHADTDPFTDLQLDPSAAASSSRWLMNDGSGNVAVDAEGNFDMSLTSGGAPPDWAPDEEPSYPSPGVARFDFESMEGYSLRESDSPTIAAAPVYGPSGPVGDKTAGRLRLARTGDYTYSDGEVVLGQWSPTTQLTVSSNQVFEGNNSLRADGAANVQNARPIAAVGVSTHLYLSWQFYDPGGTTATRKQMLGVGDAAPSIRAGVGFDGATSTVQYSTFVAGAGTPWQASGVPVSVGWHNFVVMVDTTINTAYLYIDGVLVRTEVSASLIAGALVRIVIDQQGQSATNDDGYYDAIRLGASNYHVKYRYLVEPTGSTILPLVQPPEGVSFFRSVTITDETAGDSTMDRGGTITYTFRHSIDGGGSWGASTPLTTANLRALACAGNGQDVLEITVAMTSGMNDCGSPETITIVLDYEPARKVITMDEGHLFQRGEPRVVSAGQLVGV